MIYADHAATTKLDMDAFEAMKPFLLEDYGNASQPYAFARGPKKALKQARETIASCIGAEPSEIYFTSGGSESDNWALKGAMLYKKGEIITSAVEHHAVLHACESLEKLGCGVRYLPVSGNCAVSAKSLADYLAESSAGERLVSVMFANNEVGTIQPIAELCEIAHKRGALFHTDAVQAIGHVEVDVRKLGVDMLSASAHKFGGPKGVGFLYVREGTRISPYIDGGAQERGMRAGTENVAGIVGMAAALEKSCRHMKARNEHLLELEALLLDALKSEDGEGRRLDFRRNGDVYHIPGNVSLSFRQADGEVLLHRLDLMGICVSTGSACNSEATELSHVLSAMAVPFEYAYGTVRISLGYENTAGDVEKIAAALKKIRIL